MIEALTDPKTWLFASFCALANVPNSLTNQRQLIVASYGFTQLQTTLLSCVDGVVEVLTILTGVQVRRKLFGSDRWATNLTLPRSRPVYPTLERMSASHTCCQISSGSS